MLEATRRPGDDGPAGAVDWTALSAELDELIEQAPAARAAWLERRRDLQAPLRARMQRLLRAHEWAGHGAMFETLPRLGQSEVGSRPPALSAGQRVGPFVLERELGVGGMGAVWLAAYADHRIDRRVALKLPHATLSVPTLAARFERERAALAAIEHPNIARLYDTGVTDSGLAYLALEYVEGTPIDRHCDSHRMPVAARIALFLQVADAVHFAHQALVVHRDLKPGNILVNQRGDVRLVDFGIAKILERPEPDDATPPTELDGGALTPPYAAPEQFVRGQITTATDIYALGVVLYQLLTGCLPHRPRRSTRAAIEQAVLEDEPVAPSRAEMDDSIAARRGVSLPKLRGALAGDLDTIVLKALKKVPAERYASADVLAQDLRRHLRGEPIAAMPDRWTYRAAKFVRRHRVGVTVAGATAAVLVIAATVAVAQFLRAQEQQQQAVAIKSFLADVLSESESSDATGSTGVTGKSIVDAGVARAERDFADRPVLRGELLVELGRLYGRHGDKEASRVTLEKAIATLGGRVSNESPALNEARAHLAELLQDRRDLDQAEALAGAAVRDCSIDSGPCAKARALGHLVLSRCAFLRGNLEQQLVAAQRSLAEFRRSAGESHADTASAWETLAIALRNNGRYDEASTALHRAVAIAEGQSLRLTHRRRLKQMVAVFAVDAGKYAEALASFAALIQETPPEGGANENVAQLHVLYATTLNHQGLTAKALEQVELAFKRAEGDRRGIQRAWATQQQARAWSLLGRHDQAIAAIRGVLEGFERSNPAPTLLSETARRLLGEFLVRAGHIEDAYTVLTTNLGHLRRLFAEHDHRVAATRELLGTTERLRGNHDAARQWHEQARLSIEQRFDAQHPVRLANAVSAAINEYARAAGEDERKAALAALDAYMNRFPADSYWRQIAARAHAALSEKAPRRATRFSEVVLSH
jgi:serine/threonine-protein kinase